MNYFCLRFLRIFEEILIKFKTGKESVHSHDGFEGPWRQLTLERVNQTAADGFLFPCTCSHYLYAQRFCTSRFYFNFFRFFFLICHSWTAHFVSSSRNKSTNDEAILQNVFLSMAFHTTYRLKFEQCHVFEDVLVLQILSQNGSAGFIFAPEWNSVCLIWRTLAVSVILTDDQLIVPLVLHMFLLLIPQLLQALYPSFDITDRAFKQLK